ncbi:hypothetical protein [Planococcus glaciei]|uniref:hypothetical protein n=1 Tax=Planococcus glaciei TaxID=459472 RepID=UPI001C730276|nr:hypothetical protein [Planococcus glaciei]MBX0314161.1 hypothetical protein [Planococcus glaciei]
MPQINKVRIINFSYNNHNRHIVDETFDFYKGENALLNLKNGGGKSVLVQLMLQPILPKTRLMNRKVEDFFKGKNMPAYILIEWKLEDRGGYLLTGIALANRETQVRETNESVNQVKYFTFASHYKQPGLYDIDNIPLVQKSDNKLYIEGFKKANQMIKEAKGQIELFNDDDGSAYKSYLESFNIFQDEWKSIVLKINESEGGVIEIFEKCKTSLQLMNEWILKSIEKVVHKDESDQKKLEQMFENLVEEMIRNEQFLLEKELYGAFLIEINFFLKKLEDLTVSIHEEEEQESQIAGMYAFLSGQLLIIDEEIKHQKALILNAEVEKRNIDIEERSKEFYDQQDKVSDLLGQLDEAGVVLEEIRTEIANNDQQKLIQEAAKLDKSLQETKIRIAGIEAEIRKINSDSEANEEIKTLSYSLKLGYENVLAEYQKQSKNLENRMVAAQAAMTNFTNEINNLEKQDTKLVAAKSRLSYKIEQFEENEQKACTELEMKYERNLLGGIETSYFDSYFSRLEEKESILEKEKLAVEQSEAVLKTQEEKTKVRLREIQNNEKGLLLKQANLENEIGVYTRLESAVEAAFARYGIGNNQKFEHEENSQVMAVKITELERVEREIDLEIRTKTETLASMKDGTLHVSSEFRQWLINEGIDFETGEKYLQNQSENIRKELIRENPILPFAFLFNEPELQKVKKLEIGITINQLVPLLLLSGIKQEFPADGHAVSLSSQLQVLSLYNQRMFEAESLEAYKEELQSQKKVLQERYEHFRSQLGIAREDASLFIQFKYDENDLFKMEMKMENLNKELGNLKEEQQGLERLQSTFHKKFTDVRDQEQVIERRLESIAVQHAGVIGFIAENSHYLENLKLLEDADEKIRIIAKDKKELGSQRDNVVNGKEMMIAEKFTLQNIILDVKKKYVLVENAQETEVLEEEITIMQEKLDALKRNMTTDLSRLENDLGGKQSEKAIIEQDLILLGIEEELYIQVNFDAAMLASLQKRGTELRTKEKKVDKKQRELEKSHSKAEGSMESAEKELKKLADEPLDRSLIKLNFHARRKEQKNIISDADSSLAECRQQKASYKEVMAKIQANDIALENDGKHEYTIQKGVHEDFADLFQELNMTRKENRKHKNNIHNRYSAIRANYQGKNRNIENLLDGIEPMIENAQQDGNQYYYLYERTALSAEQLKHLIKASEQRLQNLEKNKMDLIQHSYLQAKQTFEEIQKISENSAVKILGVNRRMLRINMEKFNDNENENIMKIHNYIESCITMIRTDMKEGKEKEESRRKISKAMATKELLNVLSDLGKMSIQAYKIDINAKNSGYKSWEQVIKENSGGERFVSFFSVLVALMSYTRTSMKYEDDYQRNKDTKVLIMDNPFGPISSEHLLKPLFEIAKKYNTQLICLTDLKQNSIMNCFNLVYMIKIRPNVLGTAEYLKLERQAKEEVTEENLEKAVFRVGEQTSLF